MHVDHVFAGLPVADFDAAVAWYERLLGRPPDLVPKKDDAAWQLAGGGWIYVVADSRRAGNALLTLLVDDLGAHLAAIGERGIGAGPIEVLPGTVRRAVITDLDGNTITLGQAG